MTYVIDLDGTLCKETVGWDYANRTPVPSRIKKVNRLYDIGHTIIIHTSRFIEDLDVTAAWLDEHGVKFHTLILGKPQADAYVDDKAVSPEQFFQEKKKKIEDKMLH